METIVRAACPKCHTELRIPAQWVGKTMRCKACRALVRSWPRSEAAVATYGLAAPVPNGVEHAVPAPPRSDEPFLIPEPGAIPVPAIDPAAAFEPPPQPLPLPGYPYPMPPGYPPAGYPPAAYPMPAMPQAAYPMPQAPLVLETPAENAAAPGRRYRRGKSGGKLVWVAVCLLLTAGLITGGIYGKKYLDEQNAKPGPDDGAKTDGKGDGKIDTGATKSGPFPRRLLFISISKYMYLNPLTATNKDGDDQSRPAAHRIAYDWRIPTDKENNQVFLLSDSTRDSTILVKSVVTGACDRFFETSRDQDRIVLYFGGHAFEKDGKAYLAPAEGEIDGEGWQDTLIPLDEFYAKLKECKAGQKLVLWDVCRFNPDRGKQRPGSDPMSPALHKALAAAPPGVEVVISCSPGENALEFISFQPDQTSKKTYSGSSFLESIRHVGEKSKSARAPTPADALPIAEWSQAVGKRVGEMAALVKDGPKQTVTLEGKPRGEAVAYKHDEPPAKRFDMPAPPKGTSGVEIASIVQEFNIPPVRPDLKDTGLADLPYFDAARMKDYQADVKLDVIHKNKEKYRLRALTIDAFEAIREVWGGAGSDQLGRIDDVVIEAPITETLKKEINQKLEAYAIGIAKLELVNLELDNVESLKKDEPKRWQAHYEYARAVLKARLAYLNEYNKLMGDVRTETLPALDKSIGQDSYKLASSEKMKSKKDVQKLAEEAQEAYAKLIVEHKGTPWALQAKRDRSFSLGLVWQPFVSKPAENKDGTQ